MAENNPENYFVRVPRPQRSAGERVACQTASLMPLEVKASNHCNRRLLVTAIIYLTEGNNSGTLRPIDANGHAWYVKKMTFKYQMYPS